MYLHADFCEAGRNQTSNRSFVELVKARSKDPKFLRRICHLNVLEILTNEKHFPKFASQ